MDVSRLRVAAACLLLGACSSEVAPTNPYDPLSASPMPGAVVGRVTAPGRLSAEGIRLFLEAGSDPVAQADTGADGAFLLAAVPPGRYSLAIREEGFYAVKLFPVEVAVGQTVDVGELPLQSLATGADASVIAGTALFEGRTDHGGIVVAARGTTFRTQTGADGSYALTVAEGTYDLQLSAPEWSPVERAGVVVGRGETLTLEPVTLTRSPATITGVVRRRSCTPDPADETTELAEGALVSAVGTGATAVTDTLGQFVLTGLPGGTWIVRATLAGQDPGDSLPVTVRGGETAALSEELVLVAARGAVVGHVLLTDRVEHGGTLVQLTGVPGFTSVTAQDGAFRIRDVCAGEGYALAAFATQDGFLPGSASGITVLSGQDSAAVELVLAPQVGGLELSDGLDSVARLDLTYSLQAPAGTTEMRFALVEFADPEAGWGPYAPAGTLPMLLPDRDGSHTVHAQLRGGGAVSAVFRDTVVLDRVAPASPTVVIEGGGLYSNDPDGSVTLTLSASDAAVAPVDRTSGLAAMKLLNHDLQGGGAAPSDPADPRWLDPALVPVLPYLRTYDHPLLRPNQDEAKELWVRFGDAAGNWSAPLAAGVTLDREAPDGAAVEIVSLTPGFVNDSRVDLLLTASDENPGLQVRISGSSTFLGAVLQPVPAPPTVSWNLPQLDGPQTVWVQYADLAGNLGTPLSATIELDRQAPTGTRFTIDQAPYSPGGVLDLTLSAQGATEMIFSLGPDFTDAAGAPEPWLPFAASATFTLPAGDGPAVIWGKFRDRAHNESVRLSADVTVDSIAPVVSGLQVLEGQVVPAAAVNLLITALPGPLDANELRIDVQDGPPAGPVIAGAWQPFNPGVAVTLPPGAGVKELQVTVRDAAGNLSSPGTTRVTLDDVPPMLVAVELAGGAAWVNDPSLLLTVDTVGADQVLISNRGDFAGSTWQPLTSPSIGWALPATDGTHTVFVRVRDLAGNEVSGSAQVGLDLAAPQPVAVGIDGGAAYSRDLTVDLLLSATDALSGVVSAEVDTEASFGGATPVIWGGAGSQPLAGFALEAQEGPQTVHVRYRDAAGNSSVASATIRVDTGSPAGSVAIDGGAAFARQAAVTLGFVAPADAVQLKVVDGAVASCAAPLQAFTGTLPWLLPGADGPKSVAVCFVDAAGNSATATTSIVLDRQDPAGTVAIAGGATHVASRDVLLTLTSAADVVSMSLANAGSLNCATATYEPFSSPRSWTLAAGDGAKTVAACFRDGAGRTASTTGSTFLDTAAPTGGVAIDGGATYSRDSTVDLTLTAADAGGSGVAFADVANDPSYSGAVRVVWAGGASQPLPAFALVTGDGPRTVYARYTDRAGNQLQAAATVVVDTAPPTGTISINGGAAYTQLAGVTLALAAPADTVQLKIVDGAIASCAAPLSGYASTVPRTLPAGDGPKQLSACFVDAAGNTATATASIVLDGTDPTGTVAIDGGAAYTRDRDVTLTLTASADTVQLALANAGSLNCATAIYEPYVVQRAWTLTSGDGSKTVAVCFKDAAGRTGGNTATAVLDGTVPAAALAIDGGATYSRDSTVDLLLTASDAGSGVLRYELATDATFAGAIAAAWPGGASIPVNGFALVARDGPRSVFLRITDGAGNQSQAVATVEVDSAAPLGTLRINGGAAFTQVTGVNLDTASAADVFELAAADGAAINCALAAYSPYVTPRAHTLPAGGGNKPVSVCFRDRAGNTASATATIGLDADVPTVSSVSINGGAASTITTLVSLAIAATDPVPGAVAEMQLSEDAGFAGAAWEPFVASRSWSLGSTNGTKTLYARVRDGSGRVSGSVSDTIVLDTERPAPVSLRVTAPANGFTGAAAVTVELVGFDNLSLGPSLTAHFGSPTLDCATATFSGVDSSVFPACGSPPCLLSRAFSLPGAQGTKTIQACLRDAAGNRTASPIATTIVLDSTPPPDVGGLVVSPESRQALVSWGTVDDAPTPPEGELSHYQLEWSRDSAFASVAGSATPTESPQLVEGLENLEDWYFRIRAVDRAGNPSALFTTSPAVLTGVARAAADFSSLTRAAWSPDVYRAGDDLVVTYPTSAASRSLDFSRCRPSTQDCSQPGSWIRMNLQSPDARVGRYPVVFSGGRIFTAFHARTFPFDDAAGDWPVVASCLASTGCELNLYWNIRNLAAEQPLVAGAGRTHAALARNGTRIFFAYHHLDTVSGADRLYVASCPHAANCTSFASWTMALTSASQAVGVVGGGEISLVANDDYVWAAYQDPVAGGAIRVNRCDAKTECDATADWATTYLLDTADAASVQLVETPLRIYAFWNDYNAGALILDQAVARCTKTAGCNSLADWSRGSLFSGLQVSDDLLVKVAYGNDALHATWQAPDGTLRYATCLSPDVTDCSVRASWRTVDFETAAFLPTQPAVGLFDGNVALAWLDPNEQLMTLVPSLPSPVDHAAGPGLAESVSEWTPATSGDAYEVLYDPDGFGGWLSRALAQDRLQERLDVPLATGADRRLSLRTTDLLRGVSSDAPAFDVRALVDGQVAASDTVACGANSCGQVAAAEAGTTLFEAYVFQDDGWLALCDRSVSACLVPADWTRTRVLDFAGAPVVRAPQVAATATRVYAAYPATDGRITLAWCDLASACNALADFSTFTVVDAADASSQVELAVGGSTQRVWVTAIDTSTGDLEAHHCTTASDCTLAANWARNVIVDGGAPGTVTGHSLSVFTQYASIVRIADPVVGAGSLQFIRCTTATGCDVAGEFSAGYELRPIDGSIDQSVRVANISGEVTFAAIWGGKVQIGSCPYSPIFCSADTDWDLVALEDVDTSSGSMLDIVATTGVRYVAYASGDAVRLASCRRRCTERSSWSITTVVEGVNLTEPLENRRFLWADDAADGRFGFAFMQGSSNVRMAFDGKALRVE